MGHAQAGWFKRTFAATYRFSGDLACHNRYSNIDARSWSNSIWFRNSNVLMVASEAEVFRVVDGPVISDDYSWWHLQGPYDETRHGWAVVSYLEIVQNP
jgi:hypothetical protein